MHHDNTHNIGYPIIVIIGFFKHGFYSPGAAILFSLGNFRLGNWAPEACRGGLGLVIIAWSLRYCGKNVLGKPSQGIKPIAYIIYIYIYIYISLSLSLSLSLASDWSNKISSEGP